MQLCKYKMTKQRICHLKNEERFYQMGKLNRVFVYGTLREHESNHGLLKNSECLAQQSWTNGILYDTGQGYPAMSLDKTKTVYGEVYEVDRKTLKALDHLEDYYGKGRVNLYDRITQTIYTDRGEMEAYVYVYSSTLGKKLTEIEFGDWKCHQYLEQETFLYFAYGSCMDNDRFTKAGVDTLFADIYGCGIAEDFSMEYRRAAKDGGRADIVETRGSWTEGKVYQLRKEALDYLFVREGVAGKHYRPAFINVEINGKLHKNVLTFIVIEKTDELAPPEHYAVEILRGAEGFVSESYFQRLQHKLKRKFKMKFPSGARTEEI